MKYSCLILLFCLISSIIWGKGSVGNEDGVAHYEFGYIEVPESPVLTIQVLPTKEIIEIFNDNGINPSYLSMTEKPENISDEVRADIIEVISENKNDVLDKIKKALKSGLKSGDFEYSYMLIGDRMFVMNLYYK